MMLPNNYYKFEWPKVCLWDRINFLFLLSGTYSLFKFLLLKKTSGWMLSKALSDKMLKKRVTNNYRL